MKVTYPAKVQNAYLDRVVPRRRQLCLLLVILGGTQLGWHPGLPPERTRTRRGVRAVPDRVLQTRVPTLREAAGPRGGRLSAMFLTGVW